MGLKRRINCFKCEGKGHYVQTILGGLSLDMKCIMCDGKGYTEYTLEAYEYKGKFKGNPDVTCEDYEVSWFGYCICGDEININEEQVPHVCSCGRAYQISFGIEVDETHLNDLKFWEDYKDE